MTPRDQLPYIEYTDAAGQAKRIYADVYVSEEIGLPAAVTEHPVEEGSSITDHYRAGNDTLTVALFFSNTPIRGDLDDDNPGSEELVELKIPPLPPGPPPYTPGGLNNAIGGAIGSLFGGGVKGPTRIKVLKFARAPNRVKDIYDIIQDIRARSVLVSVKTTFALYEDVGILNAKISRNKDTGDGADIVLELQKIRFVKSDITLATALPKEPRAQPKKQGGAQGTKPVEEPKSSVLKNLLDSTGATEQGSGL